MSIITDEKKISEILTRGVEDIFVFDNLKAKLASGEKLRIKLGFDPTGPKIHLGRAVVLRKLREFQNLGHQVVMIIGDFTAQIGDPSDKLGKRPMLDKEEVLKNLEAYKETLGKIIDLNKTEFVYNSQWLANLKFFEISQLAESFTVQQMLARRNFKERFEKNEEISIREFLYPLLQGYDSVMVKADVELGGFDQLFNLKAGRTIQRFYGESEQDVLTCQMLEGTDGRKMSTSWGNVINITDDPKDMYGKIMSMRDELIVKYFTLCTDLSMEEIGAIEEKIKLGENPKDYKMQLGREIVKIYHGVEESERAENFFITAFSKKELPSDIEIIKVEKGEKLVDILIKTSILKSKSEFRRLLEEGAISIEGKIKITEPDYIIETSQILKIGKKRFVRLEI